MNNQDMKKFAILMTTISETYGKQITEILGEIFWGTLKDFELSDVERAVKNHISDPDSGKFMPKPADLIGWIEGLSENRALRAWSNAMNAIREIGAYESVEFDDNLIHAVIEAMGGWVKLCRMKNDEMPFVAKEFQKYYMAFLRDPPKQLPTEVHGILPDSQPKLIGNKKNNTQELTHQTKALSQMTDVEEEKLS